MSAGADGTEWEDPELCASVPPARPAHALGRQRGGEKEPKAESREARGWKPLLPWPSGRACTQRRGSNPQGFCADHRRLPGPMKGAGGYRETQESPCRRKIPLYVAAALRARTHWPDVFIAVSSGGGPADEAAEARDPAPLNHQRHQGLKIDPTNRKVKQILQIYRPITDVKFSDMSC